MTIAATLVCTSSCNAPAPAKAKAKAKAEPLAQCTPLAVPPGTPGAPTDVYPAPHPALPTLLDDKGPRILAPIVYPVFFPGDDPAEVAKLHTLVDVIGGSDYWHATTTEYGIGPATSGPAITWDGPTPATLKDEDVQQWISDGFTHRRPGFPAFQPNVIIAVFLPTTTNVAKDSAQTCKDMNAYHSIVDIQSTDGALTGRAGYTVIGRCETPSPDSLPADVGLAGLDIVTSAFSHELVETATDPDSLSPAYYGSFDGDHAFYSVFERELGDLCELLPDASQTTEGLPFVVQRTWSNAAARAGGDPCVPAPVGEIAFNAIPNPPDCIGSAAEGLFGRGITIGVGETKDVEIDLSSAGPLSAPIQVEAVDWFSTAGGQAPYLHLSLDRSSGVNGEKLSLHIEVLRAGPANKEFYLIRAFTGGHHAYSFGMVSSNLPG